MLKRAVALAAHATGAEIAPEGFDLCIERLSASDWRTETDLGRLTGLTEDQVDKAVCNGRLDV
jgi:hypothetical protein